MVHYYDKKAELYRYMEQIIFGTKKVDINHFYIYALKSYGLSEKLVDKILKMIQSANEGIIIDFKNEMVYIIEDKKDDN